MGFRLLLITGDYSASSSWIWKDLTKLHANFSGIFFLWCLCCLLCLSSPLNNHVFWGIHCVASFCSEPSPRFHLPFFSSFFLHNQDSQICIPWPSSYLKTYICCSFLIFFSVTYCNSPFQQINSSSSSRVVLPLLSFRNWDHLAPKPAT